MCKITENFASERNFRAKHLVGTSKSTNFAPENGKALYGQLPLNSPRT